MSDNSPPEKLNVSNITNLDALQLQTQKHSEEIKQSENL
jgi:hypothetical protein